MSIMANRYEKGILNKLQREMSRREAEDALYEIRESLYNNCYEMIGPVYYLDDHGNVQHDLPDQKELLQAYWSGDYSKFKNVRKEA